MPKDILILPPRKLHQKAFVLPGSKSATNRLLMLSAISGKKVLLKGALISEDTLLAAGALRELGVSIVKKKDGMVVHRTRPFCEPKKPLYVGNAGTAMRFLCALCQLVPGKVVLTGNARMHMRPMAELINTLKKIGVSVSSNKGYPPITIQGSGVVVDGHISVPAKESSQFVSAMVLVAVAAKQPSTITFNARMESSGYVALTIEAIAAMGGKATLKGNSVHIQPGLQPPQVVAVPPDLSAATYPLALSCMKEQAVEITGLDTKSEQPDGASRALFEKKSWPKKIDARNMQDAVPALATAAFTQKGTVRFTGIANLRKKECDRIHALKENLCKVVKGSAEEERDELIVHGVGMNSANTQTAYISTYNDHRIAMAFAVLGLCIPGLTIEHHRCVEKTFPYFWQELAKLGARYSRPPTKKIILVGMRGSGKTALGGYIARLLGLPFYDTDKEIETYEGAPLTDIIQKRGWDAFRDIEERYVQRMLAAKEICVVAAGGGVVEREKNRAALSRCGQQVLWIDTPLHTLVQRVKNRSHRPSLTGKPPEDELKEVLKKRAPWYEKVSGYRIKTTRRSGGKNIQKHAEAMHALEVLGLLCTPESMQNPLEAIGQVPN